MTDLEHLKIFGVWSEHIKTAIKRILDGEVLTRAKEQYVLTITGEVGKAVTASRMRGFFLKLALERRIVLEANDLSAIWRETVFWHRRLSEALIDTILFGATDREEYFELYEARQSLYVNEMLRDEFSEIYGCQPPHLIERIREDQESVERLKGCIDDRWCLTRDPRQKIEKARKNCDDLDKFAIGTYLDFAVRSNSVHFNYAATNDNHVTIHHCVHSLGTLLFLSARLSIALAKLTAVASETEIKLLEEFPYSILIEQDWLDSIRPAIEVNASVRVHAEVEQFIEGIVLRVEETKYGARRFLVRTGEGDDSTEIWYPAFLVTALDYKSS